MKKLLYIFSLSFIVLIVAACGKNEVDESGPADIPIKWANADTQRDESKLLSLLDIKETALDANDKADNKKNVKDYKLVEWKVNEDNYYYEITYENPIKENRLKTEKMEVIKTENGWKRTEFGDIYDFEKKVEDLKPVVLRELHDE